MNEKHPGSTHLDWLNPCVPSQPWHLSACALKGCQAVGHERWVFNHATITRVNHLTMHMKITQISVTNLIFMA